MALTRGLVNRFGRQANGANIQTRFTSLGSHAVAAVEPEWAELMRSNRCYYGGNTAFTGVAPDTAATIPTTTAKFALVNNEPQGSGKAYLVYHINAMLSAGTPVAGASLGFALSDGAQAVPIAAAASTKVSSLSRASKHPSTATFTTALTLVGTPYWHYFDADNTLLAAATIGAGVRALTHGRPICLIPPGFAMGLSVVQSAAGTAPKYSYTVFWAELDFDIE